MTTDENKSAKGDGEGTAGDLPGCAPMGEYRCIQEVYRYWLNSNDVAHLSGGIQDDKEWNTRWENLAFIPARRYDAPIWRVRRRFVHLLDAGLTGVCRH